MNMFEIFMMGLLAVSLLTTLTTQGIKKILREFNRKAYANTLASIVSILIAVGLGVGYAIIAEIQVGAPYVVCVVALAFLGWLCATNGYDKVKQAIKQILNGGDIDNIEKTE